MPASSHPPHLPTASVDTSAAVPGAYLSPRAALDLELMRTGTPVFLEVYGIGRVVALDSLHRDVIENVLRRVSGVTAYAVRGFFANGGRRCYLLPIHGEGKADFGQADLSGLDRLDDFDLVCAPELAARLAPDALARAHAHMLDWCEQDGLCFAILDAPRTMQALAVYRRWLARELRGKPGDLSSFGAGYYPWLSVSRIRAGANDATSPAITDQRISVPCSGHVAGIYCRTDSDKGIWSAPANDVLAGVLQLDGGGSVSDDAWIAAGSAGFNALRSFRKRGIRVWGAKTLASDPLLAYVTSRRTLQAVARRLRQVLAPIVFEPDTPLLWTRVQRIVDAQLGELYRSGALAGATAEQAYFVRCDADTNPPQSRARGQVVAEAGIAVVTPAQFITIDIRLGERQLAISQRTGE